jgi:hypothetical protein
MMTSPKRQKEVRRVLMQLAFHIDPDGARFGLLAKELEVHQTTLSCWILRGQIPRLRARDINHRFGDVLAPMKVLTGGKS